MASMVTSNEVVLEEKKQQGQCKVWHIPSLKKLTFDLENRVPDSLKD